VAVPTESSLYVMASLRCVSAHDILNGSSCDVAIVGRTCGERRTIVEAERGQMFSFLQLFLKCFYLLPVLDSFLLLF